MDFLKIFIVLDLVHPVLGSCVFLDLAKDRMNQIRSTEDISNQKRMSEGIRINEILRNQGTGVPLNVLDLNVDFITTQSSQHCL